MFVFDVNDKVLLSYYQMDGYQSNGRKEHLKFFTFNKNIKIVLWKLHF